MSLRDPRHLTQNGILLLILFQRNIWKEWITLMPIGTLQWE